MQTSDESGRQRRYLNVAQELLIAINKGEYVPGDRLPAHTEIAAKFQVSRPTAREAFLALELIGAIEVRHGDGTFVRSVARVGGDGNPLDVPPRELIETRMAIEPVAVNLAASRATPEQLATLEGYLDRQSELVEDPNGIAEFVALGLQFHSDLAPGCGNSLLAGVIKQLVNIEFHPLWVLVNQQGLPDPASRQLQVDEHRAVLKAVRDGDGVSAADAMRAHLGHLDRAMFLNGGPARG
ncbi:FadR/GntR family transcriptional regulator [Pseudarthrobacter sp. NamE5]|uniref:FadR/GntR family transcriptional regulator n=1 Tax=Pseudarthrobacter sp. NamE5 TaxID=2576839 RepID=UPI00110B00B9|nr:FadR/GntR family transcriptional regulator [Pseudarthrobacter sp. NamE5]TLM80768.1 FadR family transcriptional regulator [Pseudarthrobacter sp. NamE5]